MKKLALVLAIVMVVAAMFAFTACKKEVAPAAEAPAEEETGELVGGYNVPNDEDAVELPEEVQAAFDKATEGYTGMSLRPIQFLGSQVVSGTNYMILCKGETVTAEPLAKNVVVVIYADLEGNAEITSVKDLDLGALEAVENANADTEQLAGGWTVNTEPKEVEYSAECQVAYEEALKDIVGVSYSEFPLACLGTKVISGTRYAVLTYATLVTPDAQGYYAIVFADAMADGTYSLGNITPLNLADYAA